MSNSLFTYSYHGEIHDINIRTKNGRIFNIIIIKNESSYRSEIIVLDKSISDIPNIYLLPNSISICARDNFSSGIKFIQNYLKNNDPKDSIDDIHNPCNTPFISEQDQNEILANKFIQITVRVN